MINFKIVNNIIEDDTNIENSKFFGSPVFPSNYLENNNVENDFFLLQLNLNSLNCDLLPKIGFIYIFLEIDTLPIIPKVLYTKDILEEEYENISEEFNMSNSKANFIEITTQETGHKLLEEYDKDISLISIDTNNLSDTFPNFNHPGCIIRFIITKEDLMKQNFSNVKLVIK